MPVCLQLTSLYPSFNPSLILDFIEYFSRNYVQLPLAPGDAVFFNPGLHHAAGTNTVRSTRSANLLQISSALGRAMESVDRSKIAVRTWGALQDLYESEGKGFSPKVKAAVAAIGEGYSFPTNLETDQVRFSSPALCNLCHD